MAILTVYTKLLDKTLEGARIIDMGSTKTCQCYVLPYDAVAKVGKEYLAGKYAFYILLGNRSVGGPCAYVGQTNDFTNRVSDHKQKKDWWDTALVFVSKADEIFASETLYLEYLGWKTACDAHQYRIENTKPIKEPGLSDDQKNDMELFFDEIMFLTKFYGCNIFEKRKNAMVEMGFHEYYYVEVKKRGIKATLQYFPHSKRFSLLEGSLISAIETSCSKSAKRVRELLLKDSEFCKREGNLYKVIQSTNIPVESGLPSLPAEVITGTSMQGPTALKTKEGKTFAELHPKE